MLEEVRTSKERETIEVAGREIAISNPGKLYFPEARITKLDVVRYYLAVADGALRGAGGRPNVLVRYADGIHGEFFYQKRAPVSRPSWIEVVTLQFPSGRSAEEVVPRDAATLAWMANLGCLELHPHPVRADDLDHPDELRIDLDPVPGVAWPQLLDVARVVQHVLVDFALVGWPKTSGSRGIHVNVRLHRRWSFTEVRRAALALAREVERRAPALATSKWWKEERHGVFLDYNQNAKDRTVAGAYSVRPTPDARVSAPVTWDELWACAPEDFTLRTMPSRFAAIGDRHAGIDDAPCALDALLDLSARQEAAGLGDAPWPPHYAKQAGEPPRVQPSRRKGPLRASGRRASTKPLVEIGRAATKAEALAGLERWKRRHPEAAARLEPADVLVDAMRGRSSTWTRVRVNLEHVPDALRPPQEQPDPDHDPWVGAERAGGRRSRHARRGE
ncbi:MAG TPA: DNA polymerase domain-containing protein [Candidatus Binatia bacterium]|nr:DNA polymerase domain-containing protein [Candidatus Binatia bacterium]